MRWPGFLAALILSACGGGGGGSGTSALELKASFGVVRADAPTRREFQVANPLPALATAEEVPGAAGPFALVAGDLPDVVVSGAVLRLEFEFTPPGQGVHEAEFRVRFRSADGQERTVLIVLVAAAEAPRVGLRVPSVDFGTLLMDESKTIRAFVENLSKATPVAVTSMGSVPEQFETAFVPTAVLPGEYLSIPIKYTAKALGVHDFEVEIQHAAGAPLRLRVTGRTDTWISEMLFDFGDVPIVAGETEWLEVDVPPHAISLYIEAVAKEDDASPTLTGFEGPDGRVYVDGPDNGAGKWTMMFNYWRVITFLLPGDDRPEVQLVPGGGRYRFRFKSPEETLKVRAIVENRLDGIVDGGVLHLNIFLAPGLGLTNPEQDPKLTAVLQQTEETLGQIGLQLGEISYFQLTNAAYDNVLSIYQFFDMLPASSVAPEARVNVFLVPMLIPWAGVSARGLAASIPVPKRNGTNLSGCAIGWSWDAATLGRALPHEICHCLGLFHTTEYSGGIDDIDDTDVCPYGTDPDGCGLNLMSWNVGGLITPGQARVILGHPFVDPKPPGLSALAQRAQPSPTPVDPPPGFCETGAARR